MKMYRREAPQRVLPNHYPSGNEAVKEAAPKRWHPSRGAAPAACSTWCPALAAGGSGWDLGCPQDPAPGRGDVSPCHTESCKGSDFNSFFTVQTARVTYSGDK